MQTNARIARIENGLLEPVAVKGGARRAMRLTDRMRALHVPGVSVALIDGGRIAWTRAWGVADAASSRPMTTATLFQVASLSKPVTAVTTLLIANRYGIDLDEDVNRRLRTWRLPDSPLTAQRPVTLRALLGHTAGLSDHGLLGYASTAYRPTLLQILEGRPPAANAPVRVEVVPGTHYAYSSLGYAVVQQYLGDVTGRPFDVLARDTVLAPLGMADSVFAATLPAGVARRAAVGHELDGTPVAGGWKQHPELAAAGLWSTASDLARFAIALQQAGRGRPAGLLSAQQVRALFKPVIGDYGLGFELDHQGTRAVFHHSGSNAGYKAELFAYTETGQGAVVLTNGDFGSALIAELMRSIAAEYQWEDWHQVERAAQPAHAALYDRLVGTYRVSNTTLQVTRQGDHLYAAGPPLGPAAVELIPAGEDDYFVREKDVTLHFDASGGGPVQTISFVDGRPRPGRRISEAPAPAGCVMHGDEQRVQAANSARAATGCPSQ